MDSSTALFSIFLSFFSLSFFGLRCTPFSSFFLLLLFFFFTEPIWSSLPVEIVASPIVTASVLGLCFKLRTEMVVVTTTYDWKKEFQYLDWLFTTSIFRLSTFQSWTKEEGGDESNMGSVNGWRGRRWMVLESNLGLMSLGIRGWRGEKK